MKDVPGGRVGRIVAIGAALAVLLAIGACLALRAALREIEGRVVAAFGPGSHVEAVRLEVASVEIEGLVIPGGEGWPTPESLRARTVRIFPSWRSLLTDTTEIARVDFTEVSAVALRSSSGLRVLPTLLGGGEQRPSNPTSASTARTVRIGEIQLTDGTLDLYDATVARPPWKIRLIDVDATLRDIAAPALDGRIPIEMTCQLDGPQRDGKLSLAGWIVPASLDLDLRSELVSADLLALQPYLIETTRVKLARGALDLALHAQVHEQQLHAPGRIVLSDLAFATGGSASARVLGVPRDLLLAGLRAKGGRIALDFTVDGRVDDPHFSVNEAIATRVAVLLAEELGVSVGGLVEGTLGIGRDGVEGAGRAAEGIGASLKKLLGR